MADFNNLNPNLVFDFNRLVPGGLRYSSFVLRDNPLMYLRFQETEGLTAFDSSPNGTNGTFTAQGITLEAESPLTNDQLDTAIELDGVDGFVNVTANAALNQAFNQFAVECWIKVDALPVSEETLVSRGDNVGANNFQLSLLPDGRIKFWYNDSAAAKLAFSPSVITPNTYYYILGNWDGTTNAVFLNGEQGVVVANAPAPALGTDNVQVGAYNNAQRFDGLIDEVALYGDGVEVDGAQRSTFNTNNNRPPEIQNATANGVGPSSTLNIFEGETVTFEITATDPDNDTLQYSFSPDGFIPSIGPQLANSTTYQYTEVGIFQPVGFVTDGTANRSTPFATVNVDPVPDLVAFNDLYTTTYQTPRTLAVLANDSFPPGGSGSISAFTQPANGTVVIQGSGEAATFLYTPDDDFQDAEDTFTYEITNGAGATDEALVTVVVAPKQPIQAINDFRTTEPNTPLTFSPQANDRPDPPSQLLTLTDVQTPTDQGGSAVIVANQVQYTPPTDFLGTDTFVYQVQDEDGLFASASISILVQQEAFAALADNAVCPFEGSININVLANDTTPFPDPLDVTAVTQPPVGEGTVVLEADNTITYTADLGFAGTTSFTYTLEDGTRTDTGTVTVTVNNFGPSAANLRVSTPLDTPREVDPLALATDPEGEAISLVSFTQPASGGTVTRVENGTPGDLTDDTLLFTPTPGFIGIASFAYTIEDTFGNQRDYTIQVAVSYELAISVTPLVLPVTEQISYSATVTAQGGFDKSYEYFWDFGGDGTSTAASGVYQFTGVGTFLVTCTTRDSYGQVESAQVSIQVGANQRPVANNFATTVAEGQVLNVDPRVNDSDPDGDRIFISDADATSQFGGTVAINNAGTPGDVYDDFITYVHPLLPTPFVDTFDYEISDEFGLKDTATITVTIEANQPPQAAAVFQPTVFERATVVDVLADATDPEGDDLTIVSFVAPNPTQGAVSIVGAGPNNVLQFTPANAFLGVSTFDYTIEDTFANPDTSQVTVSVFGQFYPALVYDDTPLVYYPFNEASGVVAYDVRPLQANATYLGNAPRNVLGPLAKDLENAANVDAGYVRVPTNTLAGLITDGFTLELWARVRFETAASIIPNILDVATNATVYQWTLTTTSGQKSLLLPNREVGEFYHIVLTYDGAWMRAYIDSEVVASTPYTGDVQLPFTIGVGQGMSGAVANLAIYDRALDPVTIQSHYLEALGPVSYFELSAPEGIQAGDEFDVRVQARDVTGKTVKTDNTTQVLLTSDDDIEFDGDNDGIFDEP